MCGNAEIQEQILLPELMEAQLILRVYENKS